MSETYEERFALLQVALGGVSGQTVDGASCTVYDRRLMPYLGEVVEGGYVLDKRSVLEEKPSLALLSPMCRGDLPAGTVRRFRDSVPHPEESIVAQAIVQSPEHPLRGLVALMLLDGAELESFDEVAPDVFAAWWARRGARVGRRRGNEIVWANGDVTVIPAFARRWEGEAL